MANCMHPEPPSPSSVWPDLRRFAETGCEQSFRALFESHAGLVYHAALRASGGDRHLAEDVVQTVFASLARKADTLSPRIILPAWLHRHACFTARQMLRANRRRRAREEAAALLARESAEETAVSEFIDEALNSLPGTYRDALALRFLENRDFRTLGRLLGVSEDTAQKRVSRGLDRLRAALTRRGVKTSASFTGSFIAKSSGALPPGLSSLASAALRSAATISAPGSTGLLAFLTMKTSTIIVAGTFMAGAVAVPMLLRDSAAPAAVASAAGKSSPPQAAAFARSRSAIQAAKGPHFPRAVAAAAPASPHPPDPDLKEKFLNHPMTKINEKRVNGMKEVAEERLKVMFFAHGEILQRCQELDAKSRDAKLPDEERAEAKAKANALTVKAREMAQEMTEFKKNMEEFLQRNILDSKSTVLEEMKNPSPQPRRPTNEEKTAFNTAESRFLKGDYSGAETAFATLAASAPPEIATNAQWKLLLSRMILGSDHNAQIQPLLQGSLSPACYALAAHSIQQGAWEEANLWIAKAREAGDPAENALFDDPLRELGWLDPKTGLLIPPGEEGE